ncbi:tryptophan--tRNA ligase [Candidatus Dojkabacteria bacterium]|uniref:Tryptophan--tRNA ligase n=2 Tax=Candidatus Dojkabacteria TaxID=74243 RepID=A0A136KHU7_9BACT|nr:MAG: Tryptophan--tRNA ligase 2 [candidate division WS6 bacterium OLB21]MBW7953955.1 tryptophan--tRNA ligase [Candidatus Dojkabacteria bacterium]
MKRILTGDRPTGPLHLGHFVGSLQNRVELQNDYDTYILIADVQALTDNFEKPEKVRDNVLQVLQDNIAVGLDPEKVTFILQSAIPQTAELTVFLANLISVNKLGHNPTVKTEMKQKGFEDSVPLGFFMYPVSQAADIAIYDANLVPVGEDQLPHIEVARQLVRKFNGIYGQTLVEPEAKVGSVSRLVGLDNNAKMSKSLNNAIYLNESSESLKQKVMSMYTDPNRVRATDPGKVEGNPVFIYHDIFNKNKAEVEDLKERYIKGRVGDVEVKQKLLASLEELMEPISSRRQKYSDQTVLTEILHEGTKKAYATAEGVIDRVKDAMKLLRL